VKILRDSLEERLLIVSIAGKVLSIKVGESRDGVEFPVKLNGKSLTVRFERDEPIIHRRESHPESERPAVISAPMAGRIVSIKVSVGTRVSEGEVLAVLEAMKMENEIAAPRKGTVGEVYAKSGSLVHAGDKLVLIT